MTLRPYPLPIPGGTGKADCSPRRKRTQPVQARGRRVAGGIAGTHRVRLRTELAASGRSGWGNQGREDRCHRAALRVTCPPSAWASATRSTGRSSVRPTSPSHPGLEARTGRRGRRGQARHRQERRHQARLPDDAVVGVVGTLNSSVAQSVIPVLDSAKDRPGPPANTNPTLTKGADFLTAPKRPNANYFRTCTTDRGPGPSPPSTCSVRVREEGRDHPRQEVLRPGPGESLPRRSLAGGGTIVAGDHQPG